MKSIKINMQKKVGCAMVAMVFSCNGVSMQMEAAEKNQLDQKDLALKNLNQQAVQSKKAWIKK